jgi:hypothetical protein
MNVTDRQRSPFLAQFSPFAARCLPEPYQRTVVNESRMIRMWMGSTVGQKMFVLEWDTLFNSSL